MDQDHRWSSCRLGPREDEYVIMAYQGFTLGTGEFDPNTFEVDNGIWGLGIWTSPDGVQ